MNLEEANIEIQRRIRELAENISTRGMEVASQSFLAVYLDNRFVKGEASDGGKIGAYSTTPIYAGSKQYVNKGALKPKGKYGDTKHKNGKPYKTAYLPSGYKELKQVQGKQNSFVNLDYSNSLFKAVQLYKDGDSTVIAIASEKESKKFRGNEKHFGKSIGAPQQKEKELFAELLREETAAEIERLF